MSIYTFVKSSGPQEAAFGDMLFMISSTESSGKGEAARLTGLEIRSLSPHPTMSCHDLKVVKTG